MIYLDHAATTACTQEVVDAMIPYFRDQFANASSIDHIAGSNAKRAVDAAREQVAQLLGAAPEDVIFTSGSTEANNLALSVAPPVITSSVEHPSILDPHAARNGASDSVVGVDAAGRAAIDGLRAAMASSPGALVSLIATNNETGTEQDVDLLASIVLDAHCMLHLDATQAVGTRFINLRKTPGLMGASISAHKIHGPKGVGALIALAPLRKILVPMQRGGGHERGYRSGTMNVAGIVGFGVAALQARQMRSARKERLERLRAAFVETLRNQTGDRFVQTVSDAATSPHVVSLRIRGVNGRALLRSLRNEIAFSLGSACATNKAEPSHVLLAIGLDKQSIAETIRISFSAEQSIDEVTRAAAFLADAAEKLAQYSVSA